MKVSLLALSLVFVVALVGCNTASADAEADTDYVAVDEAQPVDEVTDWSTVPVKVDDVEVIGSSSYAADGDIWPTHVSLEPVVEALGGSFSVSPDGGEVDVTGINGLINFKIGSDIVAVNGETVELPAATLESDGTIYVPIAFFTEAYGAQSAFFSSGNVFIYTTDAASDME